MNVTVIRHTFTPISSIGNLYLDGVRNCYTLEDTDRNLEFEMSVDDIRAKKVMGKTCIPYGTYKITWSLSKRFGIYLPEIHNVPGYAGVRIHRGNHAEDTEGCILVGQTLGKDEIGQSKLASEALFPLIQSACETDGFAIIDIRKAIL